ncbi:MAG: hypothetical protein ABIJ24_00580 [Nitrospinota bacterium]|nr:hypothetical protein [Nitrospinota bacterium]
MEEVRIDLKKEQKASLNRPRYNYSMISRIFFFKMDFLTGKETTLSKVKLIESLASIPYRAWEMRQYGRLTNNYKNLSLIKEGTDIIKWGREAQDNEYWHLRVVEEKMREDGEKDAWYLTPPVPYLIATSYIIFSWLLALFSLKQAFLFNAEFEDHAEHVYAQFVEEHPEWDKQEVKSSLVKEYADLPSWGYVFRLIGLDERDHRNNSFILAGRPELVVKYEGMPNSDLV